MNLTYLCHILFYFQLHVSFSLNGTAHVAKENKPTIVSDIVDFFLSSVGATLTEMKDVELKLVFFYSRKDFMFY